MDQSKPNPVIRFLPSLTDVVFLMPIVLLFARMEGVKRLLYDGDTGWHIRTGDWILTNWSVPQTDMFSYTKAGQPWYAWEWLWDVVFAWLHRQGGMAAVVSASMLVLCFTFALLFWLVRKQCSNVVIAFGVTFAAMAGSTMHWLARPHLFTLLFVVVFCILLEIAQRGRPWVLATLPLLMLVWTNLHGGFFVGIILIGVYLAGELGRWLIEKDAQERQAALARSKPFLVALLASAAVTVVNPYGYRLHQHMYQFLTGSFHLRIIQEYQSTDFQNNLALWYEPLVFLGIAAAAWSIYRKRFAQALMVLGWLHLGLYSVRNLPIYVLVAAPWIAGMLQEALSALAGAPLAEWVGKSVRGFERLATEFGENDRFARVHLVSAVGFLAVTAALYSPASTGSFKSEYDPKRYPAAALDVLRDPSLSRSIFTHDEWGDYLIYKLYPNTKVFVDGRFDLYGATFTEKYLDLLNVKYGWEKTLDKYQVDTVLLPVDTPLVGALKESSRWRPIFDDGTAIVFRSQSALAHSAALLGEKASAAGSGGDFRDREITRVNPRGPRTTQTNTTRSESL